MVAGRSPFQGSHALEVARKVADHSPPALHTVHPGVPRQLSDIVARLLEKDPKDRLTSAAEVHTLLQTYLARASQGESGSLVFPPRRRRWRARWFALAGAAAAVVVLVATLAAFFRPPGSPPVTAPGTGETGQAVLIRVAQAGEADCRSLGAALRRARPGCTIRVLDAATYTEPVVLDRPERFRDVTLEAAQRAVLAVPPGATAALTLRDTPGVTLRGFQVRAPVNQHGQLVIGDADRVTVEDMDFRQPDESKWANVYLADGARGTPGGPLRLRRCTVHAGVMGVMVGGQRDGGAAHVEITANRFTGPGSQVVLMAPAEGVRVCDNLFLDGLGIDANPLNSPEPFKDVRIGNNTFFRTRTWLRRAGGPPTEDVVVYNNLILGAEQLACQDGPPAEAARKWSFHHNWWEPGPATDPETARRVTEVKPVVELASRVPADPDFLRPPPGSALLGSGAGGAFPKHVGALLPKNAGN
jgi:hypothetical protein